MRTFILLTIVLAICATTAFAQDTETEPANSPKIGVRLGLNRTVTHGANFDGGWRTGVNAGITADFNLSKTWIVRPGVFFSSKGFSKVEVPGNDYKYEFNYLEVPVLVVCQKAVGHNLSLEFQIGSYLSYGLCGKSEFIKETHSPYDYYLYYKTFDKFKRFDWGANIGVGANISHFYIGASYDFGFVNIIQHALHHCVMANVGYTF
jgi:hypothetical protein